jgi:hypothetical protein
MSILVITCIHKASEVKYNQISPTKCFPSKHGVVTDDNDDRVEALTHALVPRLASKWSSSTSTCTVCMLGLRPRLKSRPSLLDLIQKKNIDQISASVERIIPTDVKPEHVPLPASPLISPQREVVSRPQVPPPRITLHTGSDAEEEITKMPPVSLT